jgi:cytosine/uracil/thiamine/allantoin permease
MPVGCKRTLFGRIGAVLGFACGVIGLVAGLTDHAWKLWPFGWFTGGALLTLVSLFALVDAAVAQHKPRS